MTIMIQAFLITVLFIYGVHATTRDGMIFAPFYMFVLQLLDKVVKDPAYYMKPIFDCTPCMASLYGTVGFFIYGGLTIWFLPIWVFTMCGFNYLLNKILNR